MITEAIIKFFGGFMGEIISMLPSMSLKIPDASFEPVLKYVGNFGLFFPLETILQFMSLEVSYWLVIYGTKFIQNLIKFVKGWI